MGMKRCTEKFLMVASDSIPCPRCGHINEAWRTRCEKCRTGFPAVGSKRSAATAYRYQRPRLVTLYLCLTIFTACLFVFLIFYYQLPEFLIVLPLGQLVGAAGVWRMKKRGRLILMFFSSIQILLLIAFAFNNFTLASCGTLIRVIVELMFFSWLISNGHEFED
jgi:hypothetical protein